MRDLVTPKEWTDTELADLLVRFIDGQGLRPNLERFLAATASGNREDGKLRIKRVLNNGELSEFTTVDEMLDGAGRALDKAYAQDICGSVYFEGHDGRYYALFTEALICEVDREDALENSTGEIDKSADDGEPA